MRSIDVTDIHPGEQPQVGQPLAAWRLFVAIASTIVVLLPMLVTIGVYFGRRTYLWGDAGVMDLIVREVWKGHLPLLGFYSRVGFYYPGPAMFLAIAAISVVLGGGAWATLVACVLLQVVAVVWAARLAWRYQGLLLVLAVLATFSLSYLGLRNFDPLSTPWPPYVAFPFLILVAIQAWGIALGDYRQIPWAAAVASFVIQTNISYLALVATALLWSLVVSWVTSNRENDRLRWLRSVRVAVGVVTVFWLPALIDQVRDWHNGNLMKIVNYVVFDKPPSAAGKGQALGFSRAFGVLAEEFRVAPPWLGRHLLPRGIWWVPLNTTHGWLIIPALLLTLGVVTASRYGNRPGRHAAMLVGLMTIAGVVSIAALKVNGPVMAWDFYWRITLAVMLVIGTTGAILTSLAIWRRPLFKAGVGVVLGCAILVPTVTGVEEASKPDAMMASCRCENVAMTITNNLRRSTNKKTRVMIAYSSSQPLAFTLFDELQRHAFNVYMSEDVAKEKFLGRHGRRPDQVDQIWYVAHGVNVSALSVAPFATILTSVSPLDDTTEVQLRELQAHLYRKVTRTPRGAALCTLLNSPYPAFQLTTVPGITRNDVLQLAQLNAGANKPLGGERYAVIAFPRSHEPKNLYPCVYG